MYTQCPDCGIAFDVTADILKQAAGKVRCGGCGRPFNALDFLSEKTPERAASGESDAAPPELQPEGSADDSPTPSMSAEQSAALLKTLDELAGSDVRIEDTGNEWLVMDGGDEPAKTSIDELRFDDNTPLPEDFDLDEPAVDESPAPADFDSAQVEPDVADDDPQPEISLSEPDEWHDILGEFDERAAPIAAPVDTDEPPDMDSQFALQAEAMGIDLSGVHEIEDEEGIAERNPQLDLIEIPEEPVVETHAIENELAGVAGETQKDEHYVPPMTKDEQTVNMMIDQDLMALAIEDDDGFASTIVMAGENAGDMAATEKEAEPDDAATSMGFETIIMEGETFRSAHDAEKRKKDAADAAELAALARAGDAEIGARSSRLHSGITGGVAALILLLVVQIVHQSREALATIPAFSEALSPIYRALGNPLQPAWDIAGWRFEATKGSMQSSDAGEQLTIYSRVGNKSGSALPYPLIGISLTDRFEETIGSRVLEPADYLPTDLDPRKLVEPGNTFDAVILIQSPSEDATGFKLNVCYRLSNGLLRCALEDFK